MFSSYIILRKPEPNYTAKRKISLKFLIDENITPDLVPLFTRKGLKAFHINQFKLEKSERIRDDQLRRLSLDYNYIIVTRDDDFVSSFVSRKVPNKMIYIYNLDKKKILLEKFEQFLVELPALIERYDFLELNDQGVRMPFD
jgi:predicted nuclease of predicted toxin-antitoxin system